MNRFKKTLSLLMLLAIFSGGVEAKTLKIATLAPAGTAWMKEMKAGAKLINQRTEGRVKLKFYPGGVMGNDQSVHRKDTQAFWPSALPAQVPVTTSMPISQ